MFLAFMLSGFFMRKQLVDQGSAGDLHSALGNAGVACLHVDPLDAERSVGLAEQRLMMLFGIDGPIYLNDHWTGLGGNIASYIWKNMPFWTVIFLAGRMAIPQELYEAAEVDGATGLRRFVHHHPADRQPLFRLHAARHGVRLGDFNARYFVSGGGPAMSTEVLATLGIRYAFTLALPRLGVAAVMSALPLLIPIVMMLMRKLRMTEVQL